jgi:hypothetical protein
MLLEPERVRTETTSLATSLGNAAGTLKRLIRSESKTRRQAEADTKTVSAHVLRQAVNLHHALGRNCKIVYAGLRVNLNADLDPARRDVLVARWTRALMALQDELGKSWAQRIVEQTVQGQNTALMLLHAYYAEHLTNVLLPGPYGMASVWPHILRSCERELRIACHHLNLDPDDQQSAVITCLKQTPVGISESRTTFVSSLHRLMLAQHTQQDEQDEDEEEEEEDVDSWTRYAAEHWSKLNQHLNQPDCIWSQRAWLRVCAPVLVFELQLSALILASLASTCLSGQCGGLGVKETVKQ